MKRKLNLEVLIQLIILLGLAILLLFALITGRIQNYVHPRLNGYLWFSVAALLAIAFFYLPNLFKPKHRIHLMRCWILVFPMLTALLIPTGTVQSKSITFGGQTAPVTSASPSSSQKGIVIPDSTSSQDDIGINYSSTPSAKVDPKEDANGVTHITDDQFADWYMKINQNMSSYVGKTFCFKGQVFRATSFAKNEFVPVRYAMVCCAADLQPCGILSRSNEAQKWKDKDWVWVTGKISIEKYQGQTMPVCTVTKIEKADPAKEEYIYFTY